MECFQIQQSDYGLVVVGRLLLALVLGGLVGLEREIHGRPAGFRTHVLVTMGACLMMMVSEYFYFIYGNLSSEGAVRFDPARVAAQIVTGIGFLGAGAIIKEGHAARGLTTAACLWVAAGIGMAVGVGFYSAALAVTALALFNLVILKRLESWLKKDRYRSLVVHCVDKKGCRDEIERSLAQENLRLIDLGIEKDSEAGEVRYEFVVAQRGKEKYNALAEKLAELPYVKKVRFR